MYFEERVDSNNPLMERLIANQEDDDFQQRQPRAEGKRGNSINHGSSPRVYQDLENAEKEELATKDDEGSEDQSNRLNE